MAGRCSVVLIAHRLSTVINADKIVVVNNGQLAEQGTHTELLEKDNIYAQLVKRQLAKQANSLNEAEGPDDSKTSKPSTPTGTGQEAKGQDEGKDASGASKGKGLPPPNEAQQAPADNIDSLFDSLNGPSEDDSKGAATPCPSGCGYQVTWHVSHCCGLCKMGGGHGGKCDRLSMPGGAAQPSPTESPSSGQANFSALEAMMKGKGKGADGADLWQLKGEGKGGQGKAKGKGKWLAAGGMNAMLLGEEP
jgi:hypothetical protein